MFWVGIGQQPTLVTLQRRVAQALGDPGHFDNEPQGKGKLHELLEHKAVLLVLDDVWDPTHAEAFDVLGPRCRAVITTRDAALITSLGGTSHQVQLLTEAEALALLAQWAECPEDALPPLAREVMAECGRLPLRMSICGAMRRDGTSWADILAALREADLEFLDHPHGNILKSIKVSIDALARPGPPLRRAGRLPARRNGPRGRRGDALVAHRPHEGARGAPAAHRAGAPRLVRLDREAPEAGDDPKRRVSLHDLIYDYATRLAGDRVALHSKCSTPTPAVPQGLAFRSERWLFLPAPAPPPRRGGAGYRTDQPALDLRRLEAKARGRSGLRLAMDFTRAVERIPIDQAARQPLTAAGAGPPLSTSTFWLAIPPPCSSACGTVAGGMTAPRRPPITILRRGLARRGPPLVRPRARSAVHAPEAGARQRRGVLPASLAPFPPPARAGPGQSPACLLPRPCGPGLEAWHTR